MNKFDNLMMSNSKQVILNVAKFIYYALEMRKVELNV